MVNNAQNSQMNIFDFMPQDGGKKFRPIQSSDWKWTFADYPKEKNGLKVFSCFACGGGSTMGYKLAGCDVIGCCEIDPQMNEIYRKNHNPKHNFLMDIRDFNKIPNEELPEELFNLDILDGSPPCTTFSMAGEREESWGKEKKFREGQAEQTLDDLSFIFIETVAKLKPKCVVMENVEGLIRGEAWKYVQKIYQQMNSAGYNMHHWLLKGEYMGVPQARHRVFFVGLREDVNIEPSTIDMSFNYVPIMYGEIKNGEGAKLNNNTVCYKWLQKAKHGDTGLDKPIMREGLPRSLFSEKVLWDDLIAPTLVASPGYYRGKEKTQISVEDIIHIQTFPEDYDFMKESFERIKYVCGMSVPPIMIKRLVLRLIENGVFDYAMQ